MNDTIFLALTAYLLVINSLAMILTSYDKFLAFANRRRIPEKVLLWVAFAGGALGVLLAMLSARHKIRKRKFTVWVPVFLALHIVLLIFSGYFRSFGG